MLTISLCYLYLKLLKIDSFAYILSKISLNFYNGWFLFFSFVLSWIYSITWQPLDTLDLQEKKKKRKEKKSVQENWLKTAWR